MKKIYANFDAFYIAVQGIVPMSLKAELADAKRLAEQEGKPQYTNINGLSGHVRETGAKGGYAYIFDQSGLKTKLLFKKNDGPNKWNIFAQAKSENLIVHGLLDVKNEIFEDLNTLGIEVEGHSINRVDYCVDIESADFELKPENFVSHHRNTAKRQYEDKEKSIETDHNISVVGLSKISSVTIGSMPFKQIIIYNKRTEAIQKKKLHWFDVWGIKRQECPPVWRVELRAAKKHLTKWNIKTIDDLEQKIGDVFIHALTSVRYVQTRDVSNISRAPLHEIWMEVIDAVTNGLWDYISGISKPEMRKVKRRDYESMIEAQCFGLIATKFAASGEDIIGEKSKRAIIRKMNISFSKHLDTDWKSFCRKVEKARERLYFVDEEEVEIKTL